MAKAYSTPSLIRIKEVMERTGIGSKSHLYLLISKNEFPKGIRLSESGRSVAWDSSKIDSWIAERIAAAKEA